MTRQYRTLRIVCVGLLVAVESGCASVINGTTQKVSIHSTPACATATILPEGTVVTTPAEVKLRRKMVHTVIFEHDGFARAIGYLDRTTSGVVWGNILIGGLLGTSIDASNGAAYNLTPDPLEVEMKPLAPEPPAN